MIDTDVFVRNYTALNDTQKLDVNQIKMKADELLTAMLDAPYADKRCMAIARTNLEQAVMWAVKGVTNPTPSVEG